MKIITPLFNEVIPFTTSITGSVWLKSGKCKGVVLSNTNASTGITAGLVTYGNGVVTNLSKYSQNSFAYSTYWETTANASGSTATDGTLANPLDGAMNASTLTEDSAEGANITHHIHQSVGDITPVIGTSYTMSCWVKQGAVRPIRYVQLTPWTAGFGVSAYMNFDLETGTVGTGGSAITDSQIVDYGNGWYRISTTATATATGASGFQLGMMTSSTATRAAPYRAADGEEKSLYIWGAQVETGKFANVYVPTATTIKTQSATVLYETRVKVAPSKSQVFPIRIWGVTFDSDGVGGFIS